MTKKPLHEGYSNWLKGIFLVACFALLAVLVFYFINFNGHLSNDQSVWGAFGDYVGGVLNPIFGILGLLALLLTISLQASELRLTREELKNSSEALNSQNATLSIQNFENSFFQMLRIHNDILNSIDFQRGTKGHVFTTSGRDCFKVMVDRLNTEYLDGSANKLKEDIDYIYVAYSSFYENHQVELAHYFRYLYNLVKFVDASDSINKKFYTNLVRAQLSNYELILLFYNCLSEHGSEKFMPLAKKYHLFKNMPIALLLNERHYEFLNIE